METPVEYNAGKAPEKRIVILEVYGGCRNIRITDEGKYCAANIHGGWEKIEPGACDKCTHEKNIAGHSRQDVINKIARALEKKAEQMTADCLNSDPYNNPWGAEDLAAAVLDDLLKA